MSSVDKTKSLDESIPDEVWWFNEFAEFEDFVGIGEVRAKKLAEALKKKGVDSYSINRMLQANGCPHGPTNASEEYEEYFGNREMFEV